MALLLPTSVMKIGEKAGQLPTVGLVVQVNCGGAPFLDSMLGHPICIGASRRASKAQVRDWHIDEKDKL